MEQTKRQRRTSSIVTKKKKLEVTALHSNSSARTFITRFEDLPNEIIYKIFDLLDFCSAYDIFSNLNMRFRQILIFFTRSIKIDISLISKPTFQRYYEQIIIPNKQQITSLCLSNPFIVDLFFPPSHIISEFLRLETLIVHTIKSTNLLNLLKRLTKLPNLSSLTIIIRNCVDNINNLYLQIFRLPTLKYCKLLFSENANYGSLPMSNNETSPIEHLVIKNKICLNELNALLSYVPKLRYLSLNHLYSSPHEQTKSFSSLLNDLTHVSIKNSRILFNQLELLAKHFFHRLQVFHMSTYFDVSVLNANHWERLIVSCMLNLRVFDFMHTNSLDKTNQLKYENLIRQFQSSFWFERQWFFTYTFYWKHTKRHVVFNSTHPYRRKDYILYTELNKQIDLYQQENNLNSVERICIQGEQGMMNCVNHFPNVTKLTLSCNLIRSQDSLSTYFNRIFSTKQLTKLVITITSIPFMLIIKLLNLLPNIHTLMLTYESSVGKLSPSIQQCDIFRLVSQKNTITNLMIKERFTTENTYLLIALCPRMQHLTIDIDKKDSESVMEFLLLKTSNKTKHLFSICVKNTTRSMVQRLKTLIESQKLLDNYSIKLIDSELYLWW